MRNPIYENYSDEDIFELCKTDCDYDDLTKDDQQYRDGCSRYTNKLNNRNQI